MKNISFKKLLPHLIAVAVFLLIAAIVCRPMFASGVGLRQSDVTVWQGMTQQSIEHYEKTGIMPLWITSMFSGMPAYLINMNGGFNPFLHLDSVFKLGLPVPMSYFFLACISFYFLGICLRLKPATAILGALAFAYCSYSPIIITAGHETKMLALGYSPAVIGAALLIFDKKYLLGFTLTAVLTALQLAQGHQQITYYLFIILGFMAISFAVSLFKAKELPHLITSLGLLAGAGVWAILLNAVTVVPPMDYTKASKRGGQLVMPGDASKTNEKTDNGKTTGLSKSYAFQWSYGKSELFSLMFPGVMGYGYHQAQRDGEVYSYPKLSEDANAVQFISEKFGGGGEQAVGFASSNLYWGDQPFTNGPVYLGAIVCFLFIMSMFYLDGKMKWWLLAASVFGMLLALGENLPSLNYFLFDYLPFYNKFRVPTMALVIPQLLVPIGAAMFADKLSREQSFDFKKLKYGLAATGVVFAMALAFYASSNFANENKERSRQFEEIVKTGGAEINNKLSALNASQMPKRDNQVYENMVSSMAQNPNALSDARQFVTALRQDRKAALLKDIGRSFIYVLFAAILLFLYTRKTIKGQFFVIGTTLLCLIDLLSFNAHYLNEYNYDLKENYEADAFPLTEADKMILADKDPNFRVFDLSSGSPFESSKASYYHKSIGGNHAAKMGIYDDLTTHQLSGQPNLGVLNMLNTKYVIQGQDGKTTAQLNEGALGNAWYVKAVQYVNGPVQEMQALTGFNPKDTAIIDQSFKNKIGTFVPADSSSSIKLTSFDNDKIVYEANNTGAHLAVFSEVYYKDWTATIDGKPADIVKANYVLRAMVIPAGKHKVEFNFAPPIFYTSKLISQVTGWVLLGLLALCAFVYIRKNNKAASENSLPHKDK